jgi:hypothetical protein
VLLRVPRGDAILAKEVAERRQHGNASEFADWQKITLQTAALAVDALPHVSDPFHIPKSLNKHRRP